MLKLVPFYCVTGTPCHLNFPPELPFGHGLPPAIILPGVAMVTLATVVLQRGGAEQSR